jgi:dTDP-4-dehydrorhamnose 3,5-epimerase
MKFSPTSIDGVLLIEPDLYRDDRGLFFESFSERECRDNGIALPFVQDNESHSARGVIRGLHFQRAPWEQGKLVRVVKGAVWDVAVDIRPGSPTFGKYVAEELSAANRRMLWIPPGFAHGFLSLQDDTVFLYKCTAYYHRDAESGIRFDDPTLAIPWKTEAPVVSGKDRVLPLFTELPLGD